MQYYKLLPKEIELLKDDKKEIIVYPFKQIELLKDVFCTFTKGKKYKASLNYQSLTDIGLMTTYSKEFSFYLKNSDIIEMAEYGINSIVNSSFIYQYRMNFEAYLKHQYIDGYFEEQSKKNHFVILNDKWLIDFRLTSKFLY